MKTVIDAQIPVSLISPTEFMILRKEYFRDMDFIEWDIDVLLASTSIGLMGANVLIVNNYRDHDDDKNVGKRTLAVICGRNVVANLYLFNGYIAVALMTSTWLSLPLWTLAIPIVYLIAHTAIWFQLGIRTGSRLNPLLGMTAMAMCFYSTAFAIVAAAL